jgi:hypothetical protein
MRGHTVNTQKQIQIAICAIELQLDILEQSERLDEAATAKHWALLEVREAFEREAYD